VSLVSVLARNRTQTVEIMERIEKGGIAEIANVDAGSARVAENMVG
jgi:hypothetical protein